ncbi:MAG: hypothetical protein H6978_01765 [Gammaproteobacteria bacterium]|nr:hypothetical protein [Gammaproteobacteria bacterium]
MPILPQRVTGTGGIVLNSGGDLTLTASDVTLLQRRVWHAAQRVAPVNCW